MSTFPQSTVPTLMQNLAGAAIQSTYADTGNGTALPVGAYPRLAISGSINLGGGGSAGTVRLQVVAKFPGNSAPIPILSSQPGDESGAVVNEHLFTVSADYCLQTTNHAGATAIYLQVEGGSDGSSTDAVTAYGQGVTP